MRRAPAHRRAISLAGSLVLAAIVSCQPLPALAQNQPPPPEVDAQSLLPPPIYEPDMLRLAEVIGALAFLRDLCGASDAQEWPLRMLALMESEGERRASRLAGAYNRGFGSFALTYRTCTRAAEIATERYLAEGEHLTQLLARRFGG